jgi:two-component system, chemotaxis family, protein-glutamate methylesterase/glutaminase
MSGTPAAARLAGLDQRPSEARAHRHDLAVVGASAGGVEALISLARNLPADLAMAVLVVLHMPPTRTSRLAEILGRAGPLPASPAVNGAVAEPGNIYVAEPDHHLVTSAGRLFVLDGPRENGVRPAVDPLFRSAAASAGSRTVGIVLSGTLDDGAAGMLAIQGSGGATIVQDPADALSEGMPNAVLELMAPDYVLAAAQIGPVLADLSAGRAATPRAAAALQTVDKPARAPLTADPMALTPSLADLTCPDCGGSLAEIRVGALTRFRCRVGHVYSPESLQGLKTREIEAGLWAALRTLEESASISRRLADRSRGTGTPSVVRRFEERQAGAAERADLIRQALRAISELEGPGPAPAPEVVPAEPRHGEHPHLDPV